MSTARSPLSRLARFGALQILNALAPLAVLPAVTSIIGARGWVGLANGMGVGAAAAVAIGLAWPITGPPRVAGASLDDARVVFSEALCMRAMVLLPVAALAVLAAVMLSPAGVDPILPAGMAVATALNGLACSWYFIGRAQASGIVKFETVPKLVATLLTVPVVSLTHQPLAYPLLLGVGTAMGLLGAIRNVMGEERVTVGRSQAARGFSAQLPLGLAGVLSTGTTALTVPVATLAGLPTLAAAEFAGAVRLRTMTQAGVGAGTSALQGWVSESGQDAWLVRAPRALLFNTILGGLGGLVIAVSAPLIDSFLFGGGVEISWVTAGLLGLTCLFYGISSSLTSHVLGPAGRSAAIVRSTLVASVVSVPLIYGAARYLHAEGAMGAVAACEALVVLLQGAAAAAALGQVRAAKRLSA